MQSQQKNRNSSLTAKVEILDNYWFKLLGQLNFANMKVRSKKMGDLIEFITDVPENIRQEVLTQFINSCQHLHKIAFFQWRRRYKI